VIETERLRLSLHQMTDFHDLHAMWSDPDVVRHISGVPSSEQESWFRLPRYRGLWDLLGYGYWCVRTKADGHYVGDVGFADWKRDIEPPLDAAPEAGWVLARWAHGRDLRPKPFRLHWHGWTGAAWIARSVSSHRNTRRRAGSRRNADIF